MVGVPIAFSMKDYGGDASFDLAPTLRAGNHDTSHANGGQPPAIAFDARQTPVSSTEVFGALGSSSPQAQAVCIHADAVGRTGDAITPSADAEGRVRLRNPGMGIIDDGTTYNLMATGQPHAVCVTGEIAHTLKAEGFDASEDGTGRGQPIVAAAREVAGCITSNYGKQLDNSDTALGPNVAIHGMAVRRLTPRECERLQSFPDDYTLIPYGRVIKMGKLEQDWIKYLLRGGVMTLDQVCQAAADGPRYKALGNSWCVYNVRWLGRRIDAALIKASAMLVQHQHLEIV